MKNHALLAQKPLVDSYLNQGPRPLSSFSFVSIFAWCDFFEFDFKIIDGCLCVFAKGPSGCFLYLPPLGNVFDTGTMQKIFKEMSGGELPKAVNRIENIPENLLSSFEGGDYNQYTRPVEYVYCKEDLVALKGNAYKSQRHDCNYFKVRHPQAVLGHYDNGDFAVCMDLYDRWAGYRAAANSDDIYRSMLQENRLVHARLLKFWEPLGLVVRVLRLGEQVVGYTFGFALDQQTFCVYAEITDLTITGAAAYMFRHFCAQAQLRPYQRINTMDDFAIPKVAQAKRAYHPSELIFSYTISLKTGKR